MKITLRRFAGNTLELDCSPEEFKLSQIEDLVGEIVSMLDRAPVVKPLWLRFWDAVEEYPITAERLDELVKNETIPVRPWEKGIDKEKGPFIKRANLEAFMREACSRWAPALPPGALCSGPPDPYGRLDWQRVTVFRASHSEGFKLRTGLRGRCRYPPGDGLPIEWHSNIPR